MMNEQPVTRSVYFAYRARPLGFRPEDEPGYDARNESAVFVQEDNGGWRQVAGVAQT